MIKITNFNG